MRAATRSDAGSSSSQVTATSAPSSASATAMAAPIPCCAPVTSAILPANFMRLLPHSLPGKRTASDQNDRFTSAPTWVGTLVHRPAHLCETTKHRFQQRIQFLPAATRAQAFRPEPASHGLRRTGIQTADQAAPLPRTAPWPGQVSAQASRSRLASGPATPADQMSSSTSRTDRMSGAAAGSSREAGAWSGSSGNSSAAGTWPCGASTTTAVGRTALTAPRVRSRPGSLHEVGLAQRHHVSRP